MLRPIGSLPPAIYWRRRFALLAALVVLVVLTGWVLWPGSGHPSQTAAPAHTDSPTPGPPAASMTPSAGAGTPSSPRAPTSAKSGSASATAAACAESQLSVAAAVGQAGYRVGDQPTVLMQVTDIGSVPCVQNLADSQVELRVYNGESRVWGSHDCQVQPGSNPVTLVPGQPVRVSVVWSGLASQPNCAGTRQRVGAGSYTLYALLSGREGAAAQFTIS